MERKTISIMKACELVGVSRRTIYNWLSSGKIEYVRTAGGSVRIFVDTLWRDPHNSDRSAPTPRGRPKDGTASDERDQRDLMRQPFTVEELLSRGSMDESPELRLLFHRLNNQLGIILAHAELLEAKATDDMQSRPCRAGRRQRSRGNGYREGNSPSARRQRSLRTESVGTTVDRIVRTC